MNQLLTVVLTIISGVFVFVFCEYIKEIWLMPLQEFKKIKCKISFALTMYDMNFVDDIDLMQCNKNVKNITNKIASEEIRKTASELKAFIETLSWIKIGIPKKNDLYDVSINLVTLSLALLDENNIPNDGDIYEIHKICTAIINKKMKIYHEI